jgi:hypothetical protein
MKKILFLLYPFFFAVYPILELRNLNIAYVDTASLFRPMFLSLLLTGLLWAALRLLTRDWQKAGILAALMVVMFFSYGHVYLQYESMFGRFPRYSYLTLAFGGALLLAAVWLLWKVRKPERIVEFLTLTGGLLLAFALLQSIQHELSVRQAVKDSNRARQALSGQNLASGVVEKPDIYFILLDGHTRSDVLRDHYDYDNSDFIRQLKDMGFYVAGCAQSNYPSTRLSVTATFYADYHKTPALAPLYSSLTIRTVRSLGYKVITFENRSNGHFDMGEDMRLSRNQMAFGRIDVSGGLSEFEMMLVRTSALRAALDMPKWVPGLNEKVLQEAEFHEHYRQTFYILDELKRLPEMEGPKFIFAHILVPHPPYIFTPEGAFEWRARNGYVSNVKFIDSHILPVFQAIIAKSRIPPVILVMGDHGPSGPSVTPEMRMSILNAYYINAAAKKDLYPQITPVNSFRVIFNHYFGTQYPLLEDKSYHAYEMNGFTPDALVPNQCQTQQ